MLKQPLKPGQKINIYLDDGNFIGDGIVRRVLNSGFSYAIRFMSLTFIVKDHHFFSPNHLFIDNYLFNYIVTELNRNVPDKAHHP